MKKLTYGICTLFLLSCQPKEKAKEENIMTSNDVHSFAVPQESVVTHLEWKAAVDFEQKQISATALLDIKNSADATSLTLDTKALDIKKVTVDGVEVVFTLGEKVEHLGIPLKVPITPSSAQVSIEYVTSSGAEAVQLFDSWSGSLAPDEFVLCGFAPYA